MEERNKLTTLKTQREKPNLVILDAMLADTKRPLARRDEFPTMADTKRPLVDGAAGLEPRQERTQNVRGESE